SSLSRSSLRRFGLSVLAIARAPFRPRRCGAAASLGTAHWPAGLSPPAAKPVWRIRRGKDTAILRERAENIHKAMPQMARLGKQSSNLNGAHIPAYPRLHMPGETHA